MILHALVYSYFIQINIQVSLSPKSPSQLEVIVSNIVPNYIFCPSCRSPSLNLTLSLHTAFACKFV
jgi:hypothetical protein